MSSRTATTARGSRSERSRLLRSRGGPDVQDDLSDHVARSEALVRLCRLIEREGRADGDLQPEALDGVVEPLEMIGTGLRVIGDDLDAGAPLRRRLDAVRMDHPAARPNAIDTCVERLAARAPEGSCDAVGGEPVELDSTTRLPAADM